MTERATRLLIRTWPLLLALLLLVMMPALLSTTKHGRVAVEAAIYLPDMVQVPMPFRLVELISDAPARERVTIEYESRNGPRRIEADLYIPAGGGSGRTGVVFSMGAPPLDLDDGRLMRIADASARSGIVMLVPFSERLDEKRIEPEEIDALVAEFQYVQALPQVDPKRVGFFGVSVGASLALVAAADPRIAADVDHIVSFGGGFDALQTFGAIATGYIRYGEIDEAWEPRRHAERVMARNLMIRLSDPRDRELLTQWFLEDKPQDPDDVASLTPDGRATYDFITNDDPDAVDRLIARLPAVTIAEMTYLSPAASIDRVQAELFILHDRADPFIPYAELRRMRDALGDRKGAHFDELRLFEHVEPRLNQRPDVIALDSTRLVYRLYQLMLRWDR